jgi:integrase
MYVRRTLPGPATTDPKVDRVQYEADCLAGRRFPVVTDTVMQARCRSAWRLREWFEIFRRYHLSTVKDSRNRVSRLRRSFSDLGDLDPNGVTRRMIAPWFQQLGMKSHAMANDALQELKFIYNQMFEWGWHEGNNPVTGIKKFPGRKGRKRFVQLDELEALLGSIAEEPPEFQLIFLLCLNVGCRPGEAVGMKWANVKFWQEPDAQGNVVWRGRWSKPTTKTDLPHTIPLPSELVTRLQQLDRTSEWIFPGDQLHCRRVKLGPISYTTVHKAWLRIRRRVHMEDIRPHDLRRTAATYLVNRGTNLALVSKGVLNHTSLQNTGIYTQSMMEPVQIALQEHSEFVMRGGRSEVKAPVPVPPAPVQPTAYPSRDAMDWPG